MTPPTGVVRARSPTRSPTSSASTRGHRLGGGAVQLLLRPGAKDFDFDVNQISITPKRAEQVDFSSSYYTANQAVVAAKDSEAANAPRRSRAPRSASWSERPSLDAVEAEIAPDTEPQVFNDSNDVVTALKQGQVDAVVVDLPTALPDRVQVPDGKIVGQFEAPGGDEWGALLEDSSLTGCVSAAIDELRASGELAKIEQKWMSEAAAPSSIDRRPPGAEAARARRNRRGQAIAAISSVVVLGLLVALVLTSPRPDVRDTFFSWTAFKDSFPRVLEGFWLDVRLFLIVGRRWCYAGLVVALVRTSDAPALFPLRLSPHYCDVFRDPVVARAISSASSSSSSRACRGARRRALALSYGAYVAEVVRHVSVHRGQRDAALAAIGLTEGQALRPLILPGGAPGRPAAAQRHLAPEGRRPDLDPRPAGVPVGSTPRRRSTTRR